MKATGLTVSEKKKKVFLAYEISHSRKKKKALI